MSTLMATATLGWAFNPRSAETLFRASLCAAGFSLPLCGVCPASSLGSGTVGLFIINYFRQKNSPTDPGYAVHRQNTTYLSCLQGFARSAPVE